MSVFIRTLTSVASFYMEKVTRQRTGASTCGCTGRIFKEAGVYLSMCLESSSRSGFHVWTFSSSLLTSFLLGLCPVLSSSHPVLCCLWRVFSNLEYHTDSLWNWHRDEVIMGPLGIPFSLMYLGKKLLVREQWNRRKSPHEIGGLKIVAFNHFLK